MRRKAGPIMTLCPKCKSIQKADSICSICKYPIPPKDVGPDEGPEKKEAQYGFGIRPRIESDEEDEVTEPDLPVGAPKRPRLSARDRVTINERLSKAGLDGNGRFGSPTEALNAATTVLSAHGIELDDVPNSWALTKYEQFRFTLDLAWTNEADSYSPIPIQNSVLVLTWYKFSEGVYEGLAYLS
jgi:hypothetical protein